MINELNLTSASAEIFLALAIMAILVAGLFSRENEYPISHYLSLIVIIVAAVISWNSASIDNSAYAFNRMFVLDPMSGLLKVVSCISTFFVLIYSRVYVVDRGMLSGTLSGEFYVLALLALLGQMIMISGNSFLIIYLGLELMSLSLYALVALRKEHAVSTEAAIKYFVLGALASGFMLYGMSMLYGATGSLILNDVAASVSGGSADKMVLVLGLVFMVAGLAFKLGVAPFHMWVPDVYQGSPTAVTLLLGAAPKIAAYAISIRLLVEGLGALAIDWQQMLIVMAIVSIAIGNLAAIAQTNIKRMLAYSTISHMGFMLLGLLSGVFDGGDTAVAANAYSAAMFYVITYVMTTLGTFAVIMLLSRSGFEAERIDDFKGLNQRSPWFAAVMMILLLSLAGVPPMVGFYAKISVLQAALAAGHLWLVISAVFFSLIGAFYYLRVVKAMYFDDATDVATIDADHSMRFALSLNGFVVLALGILPGPLMSLCFSALTMTLAS